MLVLFSLMVIYTMHSQGKYWILSNPVTRFLGDISLEMYLCHMVVFRLLEKVGLIHLFSSDWLSFSIAAVGTLAGTVVLSVTFKMMLKLAEKTRKTEI